MVKRPTKKNLTHDEIMSKMEDLFGEHSAHFFNKREVETLRGLIRKYETLSPEEKKEIEALFNKAETLGKMVRTFEAVRGFIETAKYLKNIGWLIVFIIIAVFYVQGKLGFLVDLLSGTGDK